MIDNCFTKRDLSEIFRIHIETIDKLVKKGVLVPVETKPCMLFEPESVAVYIENKVRGRGWTPKRKDEILAKLYKYIENKKEARNEV